MKLLNPGYENESIGGSLFWNSASGNCYFGANLGNKQCSFNSMNDVSRSVFDDVLWYTGGINGWYGVNTFTAYERERTLNSYTYTSQELGISTRVETWVGKIGLPYMSDYGFASNVCYNQYNLWSSSSTDGYQLDICKNSNWLAIDRNYFTMNPKYDSDSVVMTVRTNGNTYEASTKDTFLHVYPTGFLNPDVEITGGVGSYEDPFTIA